MKALWLLVFPALLAIPAPARTFTSQKGQTFEGTIAAVDSTSVEILGNDGKKYKVALNTLSDADKKFCTDWLAENPPVKLTIKAEGFTAKGTRQTTNDSSGGGSTSTVSRTRTLQEGYHITVSNWSKDPGAKLAGLTIEYAIVVGFSSSGLLQYLRQVKTGCEGSREGIGVRAGTCRH